MSELSEFYFEPVSEVICDVPVPPITAFLVESHPSAVDRFFTRYYFCREDSADEWHNVLVHSNRICLIGLDASHPAVKKGVKSINFDIGNCDRSKNQVSGKSKRGGMNLQPTSTLAIVTCLDGIEYKVISTITGKLIEVNENLVGNPQLIGVEGNGYIAVVLPKIDKCSDNISSLLTEDQFKEKIIKTE